MSEPSWRRRNDRPVWDDNSGFQKIGYKDEPFVLAKDVTHVFYVKDMSRKSKTNHAKSDDEPKRHIVLPGKRKVIGAEEFWTSQKTLISLMTILHSQSMLTQHPVIHRERFLLTPRSQPRDVCQKEDYQCSIKQ
jgi:hypothetical protein